MLKLSFSDKSIITLKVLAPRWAPRDFGVTKVSLLHLTYCTWICCFQCGNLGLSLMTGMETSVYQSTFVVVMLPWKHFCPCLCPLDFIWMYRIKCVESKAGPRLQELQKSKDTQSYFHTCIPHLHTDLTHSITLDSIPYFLWSDTFRCQICHKYRSDEMKADVCRRDGVVGTRMKHL